MGHPANFPESNSEQRRGVPNTFTSRSKLRFHMAPDGTTIKNGEQNARPTPTADLVLFSLAMMLGSRQAFDRDVGVPWVMARQLPDCFMETMHHARIGQEHERAFSGHYLYSMVQAECDCPGADGALTGSTIHPDSRNARFGAVADGGFRYGWRGHSEYPIDRRVDAAHVCETGMAVDFRGAGIYGDDVIAAPAEFLEQC